MAEKKQELIKLNEDEQSVIANQLSRINTYRGLLNEASASLEGIVRFIASQKKINLSEYGLTEDGTAFAKRPKEPQQIQ